MTVLIDIFLMINWCDCKEIIIIFNQNAITCFASEAILFSADVSLHRLLESLLTKATFIVINEILL